MNIYTNRYLTAVWQHVTSFRGRPEQKLTDNILRLDAWLRMGIRRVFAKGIKENPHVYKKDK